MKNDRNKNTLQLLVRKSYIHPYIFLFIYTLLKIGCSGNTFRGVPPPPPPPPRMCQLHAPWGVKIRCSSTPLGCWDATLRVFNCTHWGATTHLCSVYETSSSALLHPLGRSRNIIWVLVYSTKLFVKSNTLYKY